MNHIELIERLERENQRVDTKEAQREANTWRIHWLKMMNRPKEAVGEYKRLDMVSERLNDSNFRVTPSSLLAD